MARWWALLGLVGCSSEGDLPPPTLPQASYAEPTVPPWQKVGDLGDLMFFRQAATVTQPETLGVTAVFADVLPDTRYPAACALETPLCLPSDAESEVVYDAMAVHGGDSASYSWVGDRLTVGRLEASFASHEDGSGYALHEPVLGLLQYDYPLTFSGGEWGALSVEGAVSLPTSLKIVAPDPKVPVISPNALQMFRWEPEGGDELVLTVSGGGIQTSRLLEDDGQAWLEFSDVRPDGPLDVRLSRIGPPTTIDVNGNSLTIRSVAQQGWCVTDVCEAPFDGTELLAFEFCWSATTCDNSRFQIDPDGQWSTADGFVGDWTWDCCTNTLEILFSTGTVYRGVLGDDGCFDGEMESWSGNIGTWYGCL